MIKCVRCGRKALKTVVLENGSTIYLCARHKDVKPCTVCGGYDHTPGQNHPEFWGH